MKLGSAFAKVSSCYKMLSPWHTSASILALALFFHSAFSTPATSGTDRERYSTSEALHRRNVFYIGGQYVFSAANNGTIAANQMYVEQLTPEKAVTKPYPLVFFHGGGLTGTTWLNTPDNRTGWASYFIAQGYAVHLVDIPGVGRSAVIPTTQTYNPTTVETAEQFFTRPELYPNNYPQARLHSQWPGRGLRGDPAFDTWYKGLEPLPVDKVLSETTTGAAACDLLQRIGPAFLISHSYTGIHVFVIADQCPDLVQGIFGVEPNASPFESRTFANRSTPQRIWGITDIPVTYDPPVVDPAVDLKKIRVGVDTPANVSCLLQTTPAKRLANIAKVPVAFYTTEASIHNVYDHCLAAYLWQAGVNLDWILLADRGIRGNWHFSFLEMNNLEIARRVVEPFFELQSGPMGFKMARNGSGTAGR